MSAAKNKLIEVYKDYQIMSVDIRHTKSIQYYVCQNEERISTTCLISVKAAKNLIDTHERYILEQTKLSQR